ncbi:uncharacterized protein LOC143235647 [Tachypleus tridentatus]|uniref:uncharacterized protein LOC143235647 n=1 Tax=Tachypleus tridentatus TaxID=6853 RepID=UPI003FD06119
MVVLLKDRLRNPQKYNYIGIFLIMVMYRACIMCHNNCDDADINNQPTLDYTCGRLTGLQRDGAQVVEVIKPLYKPYGFFIAKGRMRNSKRMFNELEKRKDRVIKCQNSNTREIYDFKYFF